MMFRETHLETLLSEALDLCIRSKSVEHIRGLKQWLCVQDQYDKDLEIWENKTRKALNQINPLESDKPSVTSVPYVLMPPCPYHERLDPKHQQPTNPSKFPS